MRAVSKSELKSKLLEYLREIERTGDELMILDNRVPVLKIVPIKERRTAAQVFARYRGQVRYMEDLAAPTAGEWTEV